jgi:hypothetical protein
MYYITWNKDAKLSKVKEEVFKTLKEKKIIDLIREGFEAKLK